MLPTIWHKQFQREKALREMQTLRAGCSKAEPKICAPPQNPSRGAGQPKFNQLYLQTQFGEERCTQFRVIVVTDSQTHAARPLQTRRQDR